MKVLQEGNGDVSGLLWIPKVHFCVHISLSLALLVSLVHILLYNTSVADVLCTPCSVFQVFSGVLRALKPSGHYMYRQFNLRPAIECIYVFCVDLRTKSDYFWFA